MDITLSNSAAAFLVRDGNYLLINRSMQKEVAPGVWSGVGGKFEQYELNDPKAACLREIEEETGITHEHIFNLTLRYIIIRRYRNTIRQSYIYFGNTDIESVADTDEGELVWVCQNDLLNRTYTKTFELMLRHFTKTPDNGCVIVGVAENDNGQCRMNWSSAEDFDTQTM